MSALTAWLPASPSPSIPIILCAPHGGLLCPDHVPDRVSGCICPDAGSLELAEEIHAEFVVQTNASPHLVACRLHRTKLDANRSRIHAADVDSIDALESWDCYHNWIREAVNETVMLHGFALLLDIHGQEHRKNATELGYGLSAADLLLQDAELDREKEFHSSLDALLQRKSSATLSGLVRGRDSLGTLFEQQGLNATPSQSAPHPVSADALRTTLAVALAKGRFPDVFTGLRCLLLRHGYADEENVDTVARSFQPHLDEQALAFHADEMSSNMRRLDVEPALRLADVSAEGVYFGGAYTIQSFSKIPCVVAIQVETPCCARATVESRKEFAHGFVKAVLAWLWIHYQWVV